MFVIGGEGQIRKFEEESKGIFNPVKTIELGFNYEKSNILKLTNESQSKKDVNAYSRSDQTHELMFRENKDAYHFCALLNLDGMDEMFKTENYIEKYLRVKANNKVYGKPKVVDLKTADSNDLWFNTTNKSEYKDFTHLVTFDLSGYHPNVEDDIFIQFINDVEYWSSTSEWSSDSDLNMKPNDSSTFGFKYLIQGIKGAYYGNEEIFIFNEKINSIKTY